MKITDLHIDGFGIWSGLSVDELSDKVTVIYGPNEAGKTTLLQYLRSILYGFTAQRRDRYTPSVRGGMVGGSIYVKSSQGNLEIQRHLRPEINNRLGEPALTAEDGTVAGQKLLDEVLAGIDESLYSNVFAVGLREIQYLGTLNDTSAAEQLYNLTAGLDRVSLANTIGELAAARAQILATDDAPSEIAELFDQHEKLHDEIEELLSQSRSWLNLSSKQDQVEDQVQVLETQVKQLESDTRTLEIAVQLRERWVTRRKIDEQLRILGVPPELDPTSLEELDELNVEIEQCRDELSTIRKQQRQLGDEANSLPINRHLWSQTARIEALGEHLEWINSLESQMLRARSEVASLSKQLEGICNSKDIELDEVAQSLPDVSQHSLTLLKEPAQDVRTASRQLREAIGERDQSQREIEMLEQRLGRALAKQRTSDLTSALDSAGSRVSQLRRYVQLEARLTKLERTRDDLEDDIDDLLDRQVLPLWQLVALGVPFVLGIVLIMGSFLWSAFGSVGWPLALFGVMGWGIAAVVKYSLESKAALDLEAGNQQIERAREQINQIKHEHDELSRQLGMNGDDVDTAIETAEFHLEELEELLPLDAQRQSAQERRDAAKHLALQATSELKLARKRWTTVLRAVGLPTDVTPKNIRQMTSDFGQLSDSWRQLTTRRTELEQAEREFSNVCHRVEELTSKSGLDIVDQSPQKQLRHLLNLATEQQHLVETRKELVRRHRRLRTERRRCSRKAEDLARRRQVILASANVADEKGLRRLVEEYSTAQELHDKRRLLTREVKAAMGDQCSEDQIAQIFKEYGESDLERRWDEIVSQLEQHQKELSQHHQRRGELLQETKMLSQGRRLDEAKLELNCVTQKLKSAVRRWQALAVTSLALQSIQENYESERQPETLLEASKYLEPLSEGKYKRIWTQLGEKKLYVDDALGQTLPVEVLSRGTREAVYLSLRLAIVAMFAKRGASLPVVLDDVLVNLDSARATAAAQVLQDFANDGHQILIFTCHDHIVKIFKAIKTEIRRLPDHMTLKESAGDVVVEKVESVAEVDPPAKEAPKAVEPPPVETEKKKKPKSTRKARSKIATKSKPKAAKPKAPAEPDIDAPIADGDRMPEEVATISEEPHTAQPDDAIQTTVWSSPVRWWESTPDQSV